MSHRAQHALDEFVERNGLAQCVALTKLHAELNQTHADRRRLDVLGDRFDVHGIGKLRDRAYYRPVEAGLEIRLREKLEALREARVAALRGRSS